MKIEELSVGNWVKVRNTIRQIIGIYNGFIYFDNSINVGYSIDEFDHIYIKDVIDKLGFKKVTDGGFEHYEVYSDDFMDVTMEEHTDGLYYIRVFNNEYNFPTECKLLTSIHELQNFLTMCKADLKIEL